MAPLLHGHVVWLSGLDQAESTQLAENGERHRMERVKPLDVEKQLLEGEGTQHSASAVVRTQQ